MALLRATRSHVLLLLAGVCIVAWPSVPTAAAYEVLPEAEGILAGRDGSLRLSADAGPAPAVAGPWERFGIWAAPPVRSTSRFEAIRVRYRAEVPVGTASFVAVRASADGRHWSEWEWDVPNGATVTFDGAQSWMQHRVVLLGSAGRTPTLSRVELTPGPMTSKRGTLAVKKEGTAPTYRLRVTRLGMVGGRTANGHRIKPRDFFVALPSWSALSSKNGNEYMVRLSANGKSVVVPVKDVGPWNLHDNYWDAERKRYKDLPVGWPQDHAAYYEGYNKRRAEKGWVRFPTAVDVGDGAYWALGLKGAQATVDVTFLWLGADPGPSPRPLNSKPSQRPEIAAP